MMTTTTMNKFKLICEWFIALALGVFALGLVGLIFVYMPLEVTTSSNCLFYGYPNSRVTLGLTRYCIKRSEQTDVVRPLSELER